MQNDPWKILLLLGIGLYVAKLWLDDYRARVAGKPNARSLPGATAAPTKAIVVGVLGGLVIVALESWGEMRLGLAKEQSTMTALFAAYTLVAAVTEEIIFRGYIILDKKSPAVLWGSAIGASLLFAALHPFLWQWENGQLLWTFGAKGWYSSSAVFVSSLWFYFVRFSPLNPERSLVPCFAAHAGKNIGVIAIKAAQGFLGGWW